METQFAVIGLNHATASVGSRESVCRRSDESGSLNQTLVERLGVRSVVCVGTCSRFEAYIEGSEAEIELVIEWFSRRAGRDLRPILYIHRNIEAVRHLFRVASGLDSWIIGEAEILGQVKKAYQTACSEKTAGRMMHLAFQRAAMVGKKVRSETRIVGGIASIGGAASILCRRIFEDLAQRQIVIFGAGAMAEATARHLCGKGVSGVWVANRTVEKAQALASDLGGRAISFTEGLEKLSEADIAVFSTSADSFVLGRVEMEAVFAKRRGKSLALIDLGLPRNIDPAVNGVAGVYLFDLDGLKTIMNESLAQRQDDIQAARAIIDEEAADSWARILFQPLVAA